MSRGKERPKGEIIVCEITIGKWIQWNWKTMLCRLRSELHNYEIVTSFCLFSWFFFQKKSPMIKYRFIILIAEHNTDASEQKAHFRTHYEGFLTVYSFYASQSWLSLFFGITVALAWDPLSFPNEVVLVHHFWWSRVSKGNDRTSIQKQTDKGTGTTLPPLELTNPH